MLEKIRNVFVTGLLIFIPLAAVILLIYWVVTYLDSLLKPLLSNTHYFPGFGLLVLLALIFITGVIGRLTVGQRVINKFENFLRNIPVLRTIYIGVKEALKALLESKTELKGVVLVEYPRRGIYSLGFTTGGKVEEAEEKTGKRLINVFVPTSPNPTSGFVILVPEDEVIYLDMSVEEAMKVIISGGFS